MNRKQEIYEEAFELLEKAQNLLKTANSKHIEFEKGIQAKLKRLDNHEKIMRYIHDNEFQNTDIFWFDNSLNWYILCNDFFYNCSADGEIINAEDLGDFSKAFNDVTKEYDNYVNRIVHNNNNQKVQMIVERPDIEQWAPYLWCARKRNMVPNSKALRTLPARYYDLFYVIKGETNEI